MPTANISQSVTIGGVTVSGNVAVSGESPLAYEPITPLAAGKAGTLSTRTDDNTGTLTLASGHGITDGQTIAIFWDGGVQYNVTVGTVAGTSVPFDGGVGDNLPIATTAIVACVQTEVNFQFAGNDAECIALAANRRALVLLSEDDDTVHLAKDIAANSGYFWDGSGTNPVASDAIDKLVLANGDSSNTCTIKAGVLLDV